MAEFRRAPMDALDEWMTGWLNGYVDLWLDRWLAEGE